MARNKDNNKINGSKDKKNQKQSPSPLTKQQKIKNIIQSTNNQLLKSLQEGYVILHNPQETAQNIVRKSNNMLLKQILAGSMQINQQVKPFEFRTKRLEQIDSYQNQFSHNSKRNSLHQPIFPQFHNMQQQITQITSKISKQKQLNDQQNKKLQLKAQSFIQKMKKQKKEFQEKMKEKKSTSRVLLRAYSQDTIRIMKDRLEQKVIQKRNKLMEKIESIQNRKLSRLADQANNQLEHWQKIKKIQSTKSLSHRDDSLASNPNSYSSSSSHVLLPQIGKYQQKYYSLSQNNKINDSIYKKISTNLFQNLKSKQILQPSPQKILFKNKKLIQLPLPNNYSQKDSAMTENPISSVSDKFAQLQKNIHKAKLKLSKIKIIQNENNQKNKHYQSIWENQKNQQSQDSFKLLGTKKESQGESNNGNSDLQEDLLKAADVVAQIKVTKKQPSSLNANNLSNLIDPKGIATSNLYQPIEISLPKKQTQINSQTNKLLTKKLIPYFQCQKQQPHLTNSINLQINSKKSVTTDSKNQFHVSLKQSWDATLNKIESGEMEKIKGLSYLASIEKKLDKFDKNGIIQRLKRKAEIINKEPVRKEIDITGGNLNLSNIKQQPVIKNESKVQEPSIQKENLAASNSKSLQGSQNEFFNVLPSPAKIQPKKQQKKSKPSIKQPKKK